MTEEQLKIRHVGKQDPRKHLQDLVDRTLNDNIVQAMTTMADSIGF
jgi:26S proteasome regulatory subunit N11